jgi:hypothetical protein
MMVERSFYAAWMQGSGAGERRMDGRAGGGGRGFHEAQ